MATIGPTLLQATIVGRSGVGCACNMVLHGCAAAGGRRFGATDEVHTELFLALLHDSFASLALIHTLRRGYKKHSSHPPPRLLVCARIGVTWLHWAILLHASALPLP